MISYSHGTKITHRPLLLNTGNQGFRFAQPGIIIPTTQLITTVSEFEYEDLTDIPIDLFPYLPYTYPSKVIKSTKIITTTQQTATTTKSKKGIKEKGAIKAIRKKQRKLSKKITTSTTTTIKSTTELSSTENDVEDDYFSTIDFTVAVSRTTKSEITSTAYILTKEPKNKASLLPDPLFNATKDADALHKQLKVQWSIKKYFVKLYLKNEKEIIKILTRKTCDQRVKIAEEYKKKYHKNIINDIRKLGSVGPLRDLLSALLIPMNQYYATELRDAMAGPGTDEDVLIEILCTMTNKEIHEISRTFHKLFKKRLITAIREETTGPFRDLMIALCERTRSEDTEAMSEKQAREYARQLYQAGKGTVGTQESLFVTIFSEFSHVKLLEIIKQYRKLHDHEIQRAIENEFSGELKDALVTIVKVVRGKKDEYFAKRLHDSMAGIGTANKQLIRLIITRSEIDLVEIADAFERMYGHSLRTWIEDDCSGPYKDALINLLGEA